MAYYLLEESWLPVFVNGRLKFIRPWEITKTFDNGHAPSSLATPRPDFDGALTELLIALVQTCLPPVSLAKRAALRRRPPEPEELRQAFAAHADAFSLDGDGPRFLQDMTIGADSKAVRTPVAALLIPMAGEGTFFCKSGCAERLCPACAAAALYTLGAYAPSGGRGHRTSLRGGGPLTTLVAGDTLWETVANNLLPQTEWNRLYKSGLYNHEAPREGGLFPWLTATRTSENGEETRPEHVRPEHMYWGMPRRIRLLFAEPSGPCSVCGRRDTFETREFLCRPSGYNYGGPFIHPLTPYRQLPEGPLSLKGGGLLGYPNWLGLTYGEQRQADEAAKTPVQAAAGVRSFLKEWSDQDEEDRRPYRLRAFGYAMDNMKPLAWTQSDMPLLALGDEDEGEAFAAAWRLAKRLTEAALLAGDSLRGALRQGLFSPRRGTVPADGTLLATAGQRFLTATEAAFFRRLEDGRRAARTGEDTEKTRQGWLRELQQAALDVYDALSRQGDPDGQDLGRVEKTRRQLKMWISPFSAKMCAALDLPLPEKKTPKSTKTAAKSRNKGDAA